MSNIANAVNQNLTNGQLSIGSTGTHPVSSTLTAGSNISVTNAAGSITLALSGTVPVANGGTGDSSLAAYAVLCGGTTTTGAVQSVASVGTTGQVLTSNGASALPTFQAAGSGGSAYQQNLIINGDMLVNQRAQTHTIVGAWAYSVDRWEASAAAGNHFTITAPALGQPQTTSYLKYQRTATSTSTGPMQVGQPILIENCLGVAGNTLTVSFSAYCGANFSPLGSNITMKIITGTGTSDVSPFTTGYTGQVTLLSQTVTLTTTPQTFTYTTSAAGSTVTQVAVYFIANTTGTAGANDWFAFSNVLLQIGTTSGVFQSSGYAAELLACQYYYSSSFNVSPNDGLSYPAQNAGVGGGEFITIATKAAALSQMTSRVQFPRNMRTITGTLSTYSPGSASLQPYDENAGAVCSGFAVAGLTTTGFYFSYTGASTTSIGNVIGLNWAYEADLI